MSEDKKYSKGEERLNVISHAIGFACALAVSVFFVSEVIDKGGDCWALASMLLYAIGMLSSYAFSIAGCYSPITLIAMRDVGNWGWGIFAFCWLCAIVGTSLSLMRLKKHSRLETLCYVLMGLTIVVAMKQFYDAVALSVFLWVVGEGVAYILGAVLYSMHKIRYVHFVFHLFVMLGTLCHMIAVQGVIDTM